MVNQPNPVAPMNLFPTMNTLQEVMDLGVSKMPINQWNEMHALLCIFQNTLLKVLAEERKG